MIEAQKCFFGVTGKHARGRSRTGSATPIGVALMAVLTTSLAAPNVFGQLTINHDTSVIPPRAAEALAMDPLGVFAGGNPAHVRMNVGLRVELTLSAPGAISNVQWTVPGSVIAGYTITSAVGIGEGYANECSATDLTPSDLENPNIAFYYTDTGISMVTATALVDGNPAMASMTFDVRRNPKAEIFYSTGPGTSFPPGNFFDDFQMYQQNFGHDVDPAGTIFGTLGEHAMWHATSPSGEDDQEFFRFHRGYIEKANCWRGTFGYPCVQVYAPQANYLPSGPDFDHSGMVGDGNGIVDEERHPNLPGILSLPARFTIAGDGMESIASFANADDLVVIASDGLPRGPAGDALITYHDTMHGTLCSFGDFLFVTRTPGDPIFWRFHLMLTKVWELWGFVKLDDGTLSIPTLEANSPGGRRLLFPFPEVTIPTTCSNEPQFPCNPPSGSTLPLGMTTVTCTVSDVMALDSTFPGDPGTTMEVMFDVTVEDTTAPDIQCPADIIVECSGEGGAPREDPQLAAFFAGVSVSDVVDLNPTLTDNAPLVFPLGDTVVTFMAEDDSGNMASCNATVTVEDTVAPSLSVEVSPEVLWPPNHKLRSITANIEVSDVCDPNPAVTLVSITSNEPDNGQGDGNNTNDIQEAAIGTDDRNFLLRSERSGHGSGRVYTITYSATDSSGNQTSATVEVQVPHN